MKYLFALTFLAGWTSAHGLITHFHVNGAADSSCVRRAVSTNPITDLSSDAMACNAVSGNAANKCTVQAGDVVGFEWRVDPNIPAAEYPVNSEGQRVGVTDTTHKGPCAVYAKKVSDSTTATAPGDGWFKIMEDGLDPKGVFCTTRLREADALQEVTIPSTIEAGDYLLRAEFLTLNDAAPKSVGGKETPQFYPGCAQVTITGTTGTAKPVTVKIPGYVDITSPGLIYDVRNKETFEDYPMPGPELFVDGTSPAPEHPAPTTLTKSNTTSSSNVTSETPLSVAKVYTTSYFSIYTSFASEATRSVKTTRTYSTTYFSIYTSFEKGAQNPNVDPTPVPSPATNGTTYAKSTTEYAPTATPTPAVVTLVTATRHTTEPVPYSTSGAAAVPTRTADAYCGKWCRYVEAKKNKAAKQKSKEAAKQKSKEAKEKAKAAKEKAKAAKLKLKNERKALKKSKKDEKKGQD